MSAVFYPEDVSARRQLPVLLLWLTLAMGQVVADTRVQFTTGFVAAVGVEVDEDGHPMLAEYDANGYFVADVGYLGLGLLEDVTLYRASDWRAFVELHRRLQAERPLATRGAVLISREQYESRQFMTRGRSPSAISKPRLLDNTRSVYVVSEDRMLLARPPKSDFILAEYPIALHQQAPVSAQTVTLILNRDGEVVRASNYDISMKAAVYREQGRRSNDGFERLWQPIAGAQVSAGDAETAQFPGGRAVSELDGRYSMTYVLQPCPGFSYQVDVPIFATLDIENFNPKADEQGFLTALSTDPKVCVGFGDVPIGASLAAISAQLSAQAIVATLAVPLYNVDITFSTMQLNGLGTLTGVRLGADTEYDENSSVSPLQQGDYRFDFNLDGVEDTARINAADNGRIDIWISPNQPQNQAGNPVPPDLTRAADFDLIDQLAHQGLLSEISRADLEDTDIYIYRRSTGQLLGSIEGLAEQQPRGGVIEPGGPNPDGRATYRGVHTDETIATFGFTSFLVGAVSDDRISSLRNSDRAGQAHRRPWLPSDGSAGGFASDRAPQSLRPGEVLQVIAINRSSGYIGSQDVTIQPAGVTLTPPTPIRMGPPNLKIIASRSFRDRNELTGVSEERVNIIGTEGAGLASDTYVRIQSVWLASNGEVLPDNLPGYTGRVAVSTGGSTQDYSGNFAIRPGYQTQLVQLNNANDPRLEHFYVQVVGEPTSGNPRFESPGAGTGRLQTRPKKYVPFLVPIYDEIATRQAADALARARLDGVSGLPDRVEPVHHWVYRPEMQFSVYELAINELNIGFDGNDNNVVDDTLIDLAAAVQPLVPSNYYLQLLYQIDEPSASPLPAFGPDQGFVFSLAGAELDAAPGSGGELLFDELDLFDLLAARDYLTLRLLSNRDAGNVLWEFLFRKNGLRVYYRIPGEETEIAVEPIVDDPDGRVRVRTLGGVRLKYELGLPPDATLEEISWQFGEPGAFCDSVDPLANCTTTTRGSAPTFRYPGGTEPAVWWEPRSNDGSQSRWQTGLQIQGNLQARYRLPGVAEPQEFEQDFLVETRELRVTDPVMAGADVQLLEELLWHIGISPQNGFPGIEGDRIGGTNRSGVAVPGPAGADSQRRDRYYGGAANCGQGNARSATIEMMVRRFKGRHRYSLTNAGGLPCGQRSVVARGDALNGEVDDAMLQDLKRHYDQYLAATVGDAAYRGMNYIPNAALSVRDIAAQVVTDWDAPIGANVGPTDLTYTAAYHDLAFNNAGSRLDLLAAWLRHESGNTMWGIAASNYPYRMGEGGADEFASLGLNHILFTYIYGAERVACEHMNADDPDNPSQYHPRQNARNLIRFASYRDLNVDCAVNGVNYLDKAINQGAWRVNYPNAAGTPQVRGICANGVTAGSCAGGNWQLPTANGANFPSSNYDQIAKGLWAYNGGEGLIRGRAWIDYLLNTAPNAGLLNNNGVPQPVRGRYSIKIRRDAGLPRRTYAIEWRAVTAAEAALYRNLAAGDTVCFWFGEDDWYGSDTTFGVRHTAIRAGLTGLDDNRVIECATGQAPVRI